MKNYDKDKEASYLKYWYKNSFYGWAMLQKFPEIILSGSKLPLNLMKIL